MQEKPKSWYDFSVKRLLINLFTVIGLMIAGHIFFTLLPPVEIWNQFNSMLSEMNETFLYFMLGGFIAQLIDGALGMAYGVSATTFLLTLGVSPAVASMSVHASEIVTSGVSGIMHLRFGNVNNRLFKSIVVPGIIGAITGAYLLSEFEQYNQYIKPIVSSYTLFLGALIIYKVVRKKQARKKVTRVGWLATLGGFLDSIGGGGWGPVVSSTLIARGKNPRMIVGSVNLAEFFVSLASSFTFFTILGATAWQPILGLILGGVCAAPIAAYLTSRLNIKAMMLFVGIVVIIVSLRNIFTLFI
ncbi:MAG: sulfite exporter TauE/SafE family protein [Crocinitomicaceae bacterium]|nr:sulfite exporter TauE/SafE family protein [Crocinitomicaceae bacterium]